MKNEIEILKGLHPGFILERKIREQKIRKGKLAIDCREYPQTLTAITKGKRDMNTALSLKLEKALGLEEGYFMMLQIFHDIKLEKEKHSGKPNLNRIRKILFWDTKMENINWNDHYKYIIRRVFEKGNDQEKNEIIRFYGRDKIDEALNKKNR